MARKEDQPLIDQMSIEIPNWRSDLYKEYYGAQALNTELSASEQALLEKLRSENAVIRAALAPDGALMVTYTAQKLAREDIQNRLRTDIVQGATVESCAWRSTRTWTAISTVSGKRRLASQRPRCRTISYRNTLKPIPPRPGAVLGMSQIARKYRDAGMTGVISKPINPDAIASALLKI